MVVKRYNINKNKIMSRPSNQSANWQFNVVQLQLRHPATNAAIPQFGNFRDDTGECLGVTSEQYGLIQNSELLDAARTALEVRGLSGYEEKIMVAGNGARFYAKFTFANKQLASQKGDVFGYELTLKNSFDRTLRASFQLGLLRLVCLNGMSTLEKEFGVTRKHSARISVDFLGGAIDKAINNGSNALGAFDDLASVGLSDVEGTNLLAQLVQLNVLSNSLQENIKTLWLAPRRQEDKGRNLYNLYNAVTEYLTHQVENDRFEYAGKVSSNVLLRLVNAARHPEKFAKLILPVPGEGVSLTVDAASFADSTGAGVIDVETVS